MNIYYKIEITWCKFPFQNEVYEKFVEFYEKTKGKGSKKFKKIEGLRMETSTSIKEKEEYIKNELQLKKVTITKIK